MSGPGEPAKRVIRVPSPTVVDPGGPREPYDDEDVLVSPADIGSASRSCLAIIVILMIILLMICAFLLAQPFLD